MALVTTINKSDEQNESAKILANVQTFRDCALHQSSQSRKTNDCALQMEQPIKKNKFSYFARSRLRLRTQEIWERDYEFGFRMIS